MSATIGGSSKPPAALSPVQWLKKNLFSTWYNILLTLLALGLVYAALRGILGWAFGEARWEVVTTNWRVYMIGRYPVDQAWRVLVCLGIVLVLAVLTWVFQGRRESRVRGWLLWAWLLSFPLIGVLLRGFSPGSSFLPLVKTDIWSGLMLTLVLAIVGIVASFPLGVVLALGRRSQMRAIKALCTTYIETIRGVPLISVLFMSQLMLPLFLPPQIRLGTVMRALTGMTLFSAAYTAENVRGGLAARAVGLNEVQLMRLVILPQALRTVIPAIVGQFISLFKDTSLVVIVGLLDLLGMSKAVTGQHQFIGLHMESYSFAALIYFVFCFAMSFGSRRLERALGVGER
jgi:general L-amino acid transport system permease protein